MATSGNLNMLYFPSFVIGDSDMMNSVGVRWKKYVARFDNFLVAMDITDEGRKRAVITFRWI